MKQIIKITSFFIFSFFLAYLLANYLTKNYFIKPPFNGCVNCHKDMTGFTSSHSPEKVGCNACHLGNSKTSNKDLAHKGMILIPGNLSDAEKTCGVIDCHPGIPQRINTSLMNTMSGVISVNRFAFEELEKPEGYFNVKELTQSNADNHNRNLCASCHLGNEKIEWGQINELSRGGGCNACHLNYNNKAIQQLNNYLKSKVKGQNSKEIKIEFPEIHPQLSLNVTNDHCFGCHARSGRISTNYEGWFETLLSWTEIKGSGNSQPALPNGSLVQVDEKIYRLLMDGRVFQKAEDDVHHKVGMECIDCHISLEIMGDGNHYQHMDEQLKVQCIDCHSSKNNSIGYYELDFESKKIVDIRNLKIDYGKYLTTNKTDVALVNTYLKSNNEKYLLTKSTKKKLKLNSPKSICVEGKAHKRLSCQSCHTEWVTHCIGCHTEYDPELEGYDLLDNKDITGSWNETPSDFYVDYPALGIRTDKSGKEIVDTFIPGMILTIDNFKHPRKKIFKRLYAPTFSHTINKDGRTCKSCHNNSLALGYGRGKLNFTIIDRSAKRQAGLVSASKSNSKVKEIPKQACLTAKQVRNDNANLIGEWIFTSEFENYKEDGLPKDAWIGFLKTRDESSTTRNYTRPFNIEEQKRILTVGACLTCHEENSTIMIQSLDDFEKVLGSISSKCFIPVF